MTLKRLMESFSFNTYLKKKPNKDNEELFDFEIIKKQLRNEMIPNPLFIGCSGGGGHNTAITAIIGHMKKKGCHLTPHEVSLNGEQHHEGMPSRKMAWGIYLLSKSLIAQITKATFLPQLPTQEEILEEIQALIHQQKSFPRDENGEPYRYYIDMLLLYPTGYVNAAIWNCLQRKDKSEDLKKLIAFQQYSDQENYQVVKSFILNELIEGELGVNHKLPYTEVISTQAMSLGAMSDAVCEFNERYHKDIKIKQYMTDIATVGAIHFFNSLSKLTPTQKAQIKLYGVGLKECLNNYINLFGFAEYADIKPEKNRMLREAFLDSEKLNKISFDKKINLTIKEKNNLTRIPIAPYEKVGSIMLGSQAGEDTIQYAKILMNTCDKVFIFGGKKKEIEEGIQTFLKQIPESHRAFFANKLIRLENQDDIQIAPIMRRSNCVVIRGGGLSVMEQMALNDGLPPEVAKQKSIYVHYKESDDIELSSGIDWEDKNADALIKFLQARGILAAKTSTVRLPEQLKGERVLKKEFGEALENYIYKRLLKEKSRRMISKDTVINIIPLLSSHACPTKIAAARKLQSSLRGLNHDFAVDEIVALEKGTLSLIVHYYEKLNMLPNNFIEARNVFHQKNSLKNFI